MNVTLKLCDADRKKLEDMLTRMVHIYEPLERRMDKVADRIRLGFQRNFETESGGGQPWETLAPFTVAERNRLRQEHGWPITGEHPILRRTGELRQSVIEKGHPLHVCEISRDWSGVMVEVGSDDSRFAILHAGGKNESGAYVPPRPMTVLSDEDIDGLQRVLEWIVGELAKNGFQ